MKNIKETINNDAYSHSCNCPVCKKNIIHIKQFSEKWHEAEVSQW